MQPARLPSVIVHERLPQLPGDATGMRASFLLALITSQLIILTSETLDFSMETGDKVQTFNKMMRIMRKCTLVDIT